MTPEECASKVLIDYGVTDIPALDFPKICKACGIKWDEYDYNDPKYSGSLHKDNGEYFILVNTDSKNTGRINFTKAHELGHFFMKHKGDSFECTTQDMKNNDIRYKPYETQANRFAAAFLLPQDKMKLLVCDDNYDFRTIGGISSNYLTSLSTAVIRTIPFLKEKWCAVYAENGIVEWVVKSPTCDVQLLKKGDNVRQESCAYKLFNGESLKRDTFVTVPLAAWGDSANSRLARENTSYLKNYNATLSLVRF